MMLHSFFQRLPSLAGVLLVLLVVLMLEEEVRLGVVVVCHGLGEPEVVVRPSLALSLWRGRARVSRKGSGAQSSHQGPLLQTRSSGFVVLATKCA